MGKLKYKGYSGSVEYSPEDDCLFGKVLGLNGTLISYEGSSIEEIKRDFEESIDCYLESCQERGIEPAKPYSGRLILRMPSQLHEDLAEKANAIGTTINDFVLRSIKHELESAN
ncbi:MAG: type II toxin-antitoxin system HicB family antitoxin [Muribaculaceae bacterium]|nr:type II toxin-antitoxin system HicB family antitoxin [Muribaculaceae bacterium]